MPYRPVHLLVAVIVLALAAQLGCNRTPTVHGAAPSPHSVTLSWKHSVSKYLEGYRIYRATDPDTEPGLLAVTPADATRYIDTGVEAGRTYHYSVKAFDSFGRESDAAKISATIPAN
jgi:fibronectin type 3 domain-containing protein